MNKTSFFRATMGFVASTLCVFLPSCVNEEYEMSEDTLDLEVTVFKEGVTLPLGSTEQIKLGDLLDMLDPEVAKYFEENADGAYSVGMKGNYDLSENLDFLKDVADLDGITLDNEFPFSFVDVDMSELSFGPYEYPYEKYISEMFGTIDLKIPTIKPDPIDVTANLDGNCLGTCHFCTDCRRHPVTNDSHLILQKNEKCSREPVKDQTAVGTPAEEEIRKL